MITTPHWHPLLLRHHHTSICTLYINKCAHSFHYFHSVSQYIDSRLYYIKLYTHIKTNLFILVRVDANRIFGSFLAWIICIESDLIFVFKKLSCAKLCFDRTSEKSPHEPYIGSPHENFRVFCFYCEKDAIYGPNISNVSKKSFAEYQKSFYLTNF